MSSRVSKTSVPKKAQSADKSKQKKSEQLTNQWRNEPGLFVSTLLSERFTGSAGRASAASHRLCTRFQRTHGIDLRCRGSDLILIFFAKPYANTAHQMTGIVRIIAMCLRNNFFSWHYVAPLYKNAVLLNNPSDKVCRYIRRTK